jgi:NTP pyrophosphatase (non-canonical NTP hydrolase)
MSIADLQKMVAEFIGAKLKPTPAHAWLLDLESEVGELAKEWLKDSDYGRGNLELGDGWAEETDVDLEASLRLVLKKYGRRIEQHGHSGSKG